MKDEWKKIKDEVDAIMKTTKPTRTEMTRNARLYAGELWNEGDDVDSVYFGRYGKSEIQYNLIFSTVESLAPLVTDNRPETRVAPMYPFLEKIGYTLNNVLKYAWNACELQYKTYLTVKDAMIKKHGIVEIGFDQTTMDPLVDVIDPVYFFRAPGYVDLWDVPFCGWRCIKPLSWVHTQFPDVDEIQNPTSLQETGEDEDKQSVFKFGKISPVDMNTKFIRVYKVWMRDDEAYEELTDPEDEKKKTRKKKYPYGKICWFTDHQYLATEPFMDSHGKPPFVELPNYVKPHDASGISDVDMIRTLHEEVNILLKYWQEYLRRYHAPNRYVDTDSDFDVDGYQEKASEGNQLFSYSGSSRFGKEGPPVENEQVPQLNPQIPTFFQFIQMLAEEVSGVTDVTKGQVGKQERQSASELAILLESSHTRVRQKVRNLEYFLKRVTKLILMNVQQHWVNPRTVAYDASEGVGYVTYGNSKAQADDLMKPKEPMADWRKGEGWLEAKVNSKQNLTKEESQAWQRYQQEYKDYKEFLEYFAEEGDTDPIYTDFEIQVTTGSTLPMDKQSRVNTYLRLLQMSPPELRMGFFKFVMEQLEVPGREEIMESGMQMLQQAQMPKQSPQDAAAMKANPQLAEQYMQALQGAQR